MRYFIITYNQKDFPSVVTQFLPLKTIQHVAPSSYIKEITDHKKG